MAEAMLSSQLCKKTEELSRLQIKSNHRLMNLRHLCHQAKVNQTQAPVVQKHPEGKNVLLAKDTLHIFKSWYLYSNMGSSASGISQLVLGWSRIWRFSCGRPLLCSSLRVCRAM